MTQSASDWRLNWRFPTNDELRKLAKFYSRKEENFFEDEQEAMEELESRALGRHILVCDNYVSDGPGYAGKLYFVVFGEPCFHDVLIEKEDGSLERVERES